MGDTMKVAKSLDEFMALRAACAGRVGFVPTMGALHSGHLSLVELAQNNMDRVIVSIFVNPTQFAPGEDFEAYPRDLGADLELLEAAGVDLAFVPQERDIYPGGPHISVKAGAAAKGLESDYRPHFFDGVCSVVHRLLEIVHPDVAVFGEKDYQQLMVVREMVEMRGMGIEITGGAIARDEFGLALSSRNAYLSADALKIARQMNVVLRNSSLRAGQEDGLPRRPEGLLAMTDALLAAGFDKVDYVAERWGRILAAAWIGRTRLIDNCAIKKADR